LVDIALARFADIVFSQPLSIVAIVALNIRALFRTGSFPIFTRLRSESGSTELFIPDLVGRFPEARDVLAIHRTLE